MVDRKVLAIIEAHNESYTGQELVNKLKEVGYAIVPIRPKESGYAIVPIVPTTHMLESAQEHMDSWSSNLAWWDAMLKAAE